MQTFENDPLHATIQLHPPVGTPLTATVNGSWTVTVSAADPGSTLQWARGQLLARVGQAIAQAVQSGSVAIVTLPQSVPHLLDQVMPVFSQEIAQYGCQLGGVSISIQLPPGATTPGAGMVVPAALSPAAPNPQQAFGGAAPQVEVEASMNIGGFDVNMSSGEGLDADGLVEQAKSKVTWWFIGCGITALVCALIAGIFIYVGWKTKQSLEDSGAIETDDDGGAKGKRKEVEWDGTTPYTCKKRRRIVIRDTTAKIDKGAAVDVGMSCDLLLDNVTIVSGGTGVKVLGKGTVTIKGGSVEGKRAALEAIGAKAKIVVDGAKIKGKKKALRGVIEDG